MNSGQGIIYCCVGAAMLYLVGRSDARKADALKSVTRVNQLKDLAQLLDAASKVLPLVVAVSGWVGSDKPIDCKNSGSRVVVLERTKEKVYWKRNEAGFWVEDKALMLSRRCQEVDWYLDDGTGRVNVVNVGDSGLVLKVASKVYKESGHESPKRGTPDNPPGLKEAIRKVERVLPIGTPLTVVGEAVKDDKGSIRMLQPDNGPFYVSYETIDELIRNYGISSRWCKYASVSLTVLGVFLLAKDAIQYILERRRRKRVLDGAKKSEQEEAGLNNNAKNGLDGTSRDRAKPGLCVICLEHEYNSVFVPCGHMCCCMACSSHLINCPLCRRRIGQVVRTFSS